MVGLLLIVVVVAVVVGVVVKEETARRTPRVKAGHHVAININKDVNLVSSSIVSSQTTLTAASKHQVIELIDPSIEPNVDSTVVQEVMTSLWSGALTLVGSHVDYGNNYWVLENGEVWSKDGNNRLKIFKKDGTTLLGDEIETMYDIMSLDDHRVLLTDTYRVRLFVDYVEQLQEVLLNRLHGNYGMMRSHGKIYIVGREISPETKNGVIYVYEEVTLKLLTRIVDAKMVALLVAGYEYERGGKDFGASLDVSPDDNLLVVGSPYGDIRESSVPFPGSQQAMPGGFFMVFNVSLSNSPYQAKTDPLDEYNYVTRTKNLYNVSVDNGFGSLVKCLSKEFVVIGTRTDEILYVYYVVSQAVPKLMTRLRFPQRIVSMEMLDEVTWIAQGVSNMYYVVWQKPVKNGLNAFGTLIIRGVLSGKWQKKNQWLLSSTQTYEWKIKE